MRENRPYGSEGGASQTNGTSLPPIVDDFAAKKGDTVYLWSTRIRDTK